MGTKHGIWFDLIDHIAIHKKVLDSFVWLIKSGDTEYSVSKIQHSDHIEIIHDASFYTTNGLYVEIKKRTKSSSENPPKYGMTIYFSYNCFKANNNEKYIQYHSLHSSIYNPSAPWHDKPHRHQFDGKTQRIDIYSFDHRPVSERNSNYICEDGKINLNFLNHEDWPHVKEFLEEIQTL